MSVSHLSATAQEYLKVIWGLQEWSDAPVSTTVLASRLGLTRSTVSDTVRRLTEQGLLDHAKYGGAITLTAAGRAAAVQMVRRHRLLEAFLVEVLGYTWDEVHDEADALEHSVSDTLVERVDALLGHPTRDPHGDPIPSSEGHTEDLRPRKLSYAAIGTRVRVERVSDREAHLLRFFAEHHIVAGQELVVQQVDLDHGTHIVLVDGEDAPLALDQPTADSILVSAPLT